MDVKELQALIDAQGSYTLVLSVILITLTVYALHYAAQVLKQNDQLKRTLKKIKQPTHSRPQNQAVKSVINREKITIKQLHTQLSQHKRQLALMKQLNKEQAVQQETTERHQGIVNGRKGRVKQADIIAKNLAQSLTKEEKKVINLQQRADFHYQLKSAKSIAIEAGKGCNQPLNSQFSLRPKGIGFEQWQLIKLLNT